MQELCPQGLEGPRLHLRSGCWTETFLWPVRVARGARCRGDVLSAHTQRSDLAVVCVSPRGLVPKVVVPGGGRSLGHWAPPPAVGPRTNAELWEGVTQAIKRPHPALLVADRAKCLAPRQGTFAALSCVLNPSNQELNKPLSSGR